MSNTEIWDALGKTDPAHTKGFKRAGGFSGTALKPIWIIKRLTEQFGPIGNGWGIGKPEFQVVQAGNETLVYCTVECWHTEPARSFYGVGGDKVTAARRDGNPFNDDEAFKKAFTDAVNNAFKFVGVGADIHMGQFEDSKYLKEVADHFAPPKKEPPWREPSSVYSTPTALHKGLTAMDHHLNGCGDSDMVYAVTDLAEWKEFVRIAELHSPHYLRGGEPAPPEFEGLLTKAERLVREFDSATANNMTALAGA